MLQEHRVEETIWYYIIIVNKCMDQSLRFLKDFTQTGIDYNTHWATRAVLEMDLSERTSTVGVTPSGNIATLKN